MRAPVRSQNSLGVKTAQPTSSVNFKSSDLNIISGSTSSNYDHKTFIKICYDGNLKREKRNFIMDVNLSLL